ncbi:hypothetical protein [Mucilaginibacter sp. BT774]|uniref:hypothetical protein n=1 Tax=Mucilaginibacter sp. BT774 TaxID=3062276 RepID=UPI002675F684|nr:hypothetical protein [Mucilaginibacter sp. BT774]MDO3624752.1 hypothetical protein [Mucilaginibacter sp. BT774]
MKTTKNLLLALSIFTLGSCASSYQTINPNTLTYLSGSSDKSVNVDYKYNLLNGRYAKREAKSTIKLVAVKISNNSGRDLTFGKDIKLVYGNGNEVVLADNAKVFDETKQHPAIYLLYLLLTPAKLTTTSTNGQTSSVPLGYAVGPGLSIGNMAVAGSANGKYKEELMKYDINGTVVKNNTTVYGLVGINSASFEGIKVKVTDQAVAKN